MVAIRSPAQSPALPSKCSWTKISPPVPPNWAPTPSIVCNPSAAPTSRKSAARGLWLGIELNTPARRFCEALKDRGVLCKETHDTVIRLAPPLMISPDDLAWGIDQIEAVLSA